MRRREAAGACDRCRARPAATTLDVLGCAAFVLNTADLLGLRLANRERIEQLGRETGEEDTFRQPFRLCRECRDALRASHGLDAEALLDGQAWIEPGHEAMADELARIEPVRIEREDT